MNREVLRLHARSFKVDHPWLLVIVALALLVAFLWGMGAGRALTPSPPSVEISGPIIDSVTSAPVTADVLVDGVVTQRQVTRMDLVLPLHTWQTEIRVVAPGYQLWAVAVQGAESKRLEGPIRLIPKP